MIQLMSKVQLGHIVFVWVHVVQIYIGLKFLQGLYLDVIFLFLHATL